MGRPREFDADDLLEKAMLAFLKNGYQATTMRHLEATTGVKQVCIYNAYGDKTGFFLAVMDRYTEIILQAIDGHLDNRGLAGITAFLKAIVSPEATFPHVKFGCLMVNSASVAGAPPAISRRVQAWRIILHARIVAALERAKSRGELRRGLNLANCADFVISVVWGIFVAICLAGGDQTVGERSAKVLNRTMRDWRAKPR